MKHSFLATFVALAVFFTLFCASTAAQAFIFFDLPPAGAPQIALLGDGDTLPPTAKTVPAVIFYSRVNTFLFLETGGNAVPTAIAIENDSAKIGDFSIKLPIPPAEFDSAVLQGGYNYQILALYKKGQQVWPATDTIDDPYAEDWTKISDLCEGKGYVEISAVQSCVAVNDTICERLLPPTDSRAWVKEFPEYFHVYIFSFGVIDDKVVATPVTVQKSAFVSDIVCLAPMGLMHMYVKTAAGWKQHGVFCTSSLGTAEYWSK